MDALDFLHSVWQPQTVQDYNKGFVFLSFRNEGEWQDLAFKYPQDDIDLPDYGYGDVYFCPNLFETASRRKEGMLPSCWLYADLDEVDPNSLESIDSLLRPTVAWESSPDRYQGMWQLERHLDVYAHGILNRNLTYKLGADKGGWDSTQVLRVPGTINHKYATKPEVKLLWEA